MQGDLKFNISGAQEIRALLHQLPDNVANKLRTPALRAGAQVLADEMHLAVPRRTGLTDASIVVESLTETTVTATGGFRTRSLGRVGVVIKKPMGSLVHLLEFGSAHQSAEPFIRPAVDAGASAAVRAIFANLANGIRREAQRLAGTLKPKGR